MMFCIVSNIINHWIVKITQIGSDMHQRETDLEQIKKNRELLLPTLLFRGRSFLGNMLTCRFADELTEVT